MASNWKTVRAKAAQEGRLDEARVARHKAQALAAIEAYQLVELRQAAGLSQVEVAQQLGVSQGWISRLERGELDRTEIGTLRRYVQALGAHLEITARVGDQRLVVFDGRTSQASVQAAPSLEEVPALPPTHLLDPTSAPAPQEVYHA